MFKFLKTDPAKKAKKYIDKALIEIEEGYPEYASVEYEKAARCFLEIEQTDFAVKYFREAAYCALENNNHTRCSEMKVAAAECLLQEGRYDEAGGLYSESSDHLHREKKSKESNRSLGVAIAGYLSARNFSTAINLMRKAEKRIQDTSSKKDPIYVLAEFCVNILCEGIDVPSDQFENAAKNIRPNAFEKPLFDFLIASTKLALQTEIVLDWAGAKQKEVSVKEPIEIELRYKCPVEVQIIDHRLSLSNSVIMTKQPEYALSPSKEESWLLEFKPVLSGEGSIGPFTVTLEGDKVLVNKHTNTLNFQIAKAPSNLKLEVSPERVSCNLGDEAILQVIVLNEGDGPAENIETKVELSDGLELSLGNESKLVHFLGSGEKVHFQVFVRAVGQGEELVTIKVVDGRLGQEVVKTSVVRVG